MILELPEASRIWIRLESTADVEIECPGMSFFVHKVVLRANWVFESELRSATVSSKKPNLSLIELDDEPWFIEVLLNHCYKGLCCVNTLNRLAVRGDSCRLRPLKDEEESLFRHLVILHEMLYKYSENPMPTEYDVLDTFNHHIGTFVSAAKEDCYDRMQPALDEYATLAKKEYHNTVGFKLTPAGGARIARLVIESTRRTKAIRDSECDGWLSFKSLNSHRSNHYTEMQDRLFLEISRNLDVFRQNRQLWGELISIPGFIVGFACFVDITGQRLRFCAECNKGSSLDMTDCFFSGKRQQCPHCSEEASLQTWNTTFYEDDEPLTKDSEGWDWHPPIWHLRGETWRLHLSKIVGSETVDVWLENEGAAAFKRARV
ncbi:hypothetical protein IWZ01DRAFT_558060 [Phyllosticta capitalensis]